MSMTVVFAPGGKRTVIDTRTLAEAITEAVERIRLEYEAQIARGTTYSGKPLQIDKDSQDNMAAVGALVAAELPLPTGFAWRMGDNSFLPVNATQMLGLAKTASDRVMALRVAMWTAVDGARAAKTNAEADAVKAAWP